MIPRGAIATPLACACLLMLVLQAQAQTLTVRGTVRDANTHRAIADVNIGVPGRGIGTTTDAAGAYTLRIPDAEGVSDIIFRHVSYASDTVSLSVLRSRGDVMLLPRIIPLESTEITGTRREGAAAKDLPLAVSTIEAREFDVRGYIDAGDLLRTEHSVQVEEEFSGRKRVSIRGGNADEVIVLYDGLRLNSSYASDFDLALVELADIERFEIIKGSNTTLYGSEAFSGVINIVPKQEREYTVRLHQQIGSYDSGTWGLQLFRRFGRFAGSYSVRSGGMARAFDDMPEAQLTNSRVFHSGSLAYRFSGDSSDAEELSLNWRVANLSYENERDAERLDDRNHFAGLQYDGTLPLLGEIALLAGYNGLRQDLALRSTAASVERGIHEDGAQARLEKHWRPGGIDMLFSYQFAHSRLDLEDHRRNEREQPVGIESSALGRLHHGLVAIAKLQGETGSAFFRGFDLDLSLRQDFLHDSQEGVTLREGSSSAETFSGHDWSHTLFKFAVGMKGMQENFLLDIFLSYGNNVRYPTLFQQVNSPALLDPGAAVPMLEPETNRSVEVGAALTRALSEGAVSGWEVEANFFQNSYDNKFRGITTPGIPVTLFDNVDNASITGLEGRAGIFFWGRKVRTEFGISRYFIPEKSAFPFKSESKRTISLLVDHAGYSLHVFHFAEGEQIGLLRQSDGSYAEIALPAFSNLDVHASAFFDVGKVKLFLNISLRNLLGGDGVALSGLALRDRQYYLTAGIQY